MNDPSLDAWIGAARFANDLLSGGNSNQRHKGERFHITKRDYEENGNGYLAEHRCGNIRYE